MATISDRIAWVLVPSFLSVVYASAPTLAQNFLAETTHSRNFRAYAAGHELTTPNYSDFFAFENPLELRSVGAVISAAGNLIAYDNQPAIQYDIIINWAGFEFPATVCHQYIESVGYFGTSIAVSSGQGFGGIEDLEQYADTKCHDDGPLVAVRSWRPPIEFSPIGLTALFLELRREYIAIQLLNSLPNLPITHQDMFSDALGIPITGASQTLPRAQSGLTPSVNNATLQLVHPYAEFRDEQGENVGAYGYAAAISIIDINDDGYPEVLSFPTNRIEARPLQILAYENTGETFSYNDQMITPSNQEAVRDRIVADFDNDGYDDLLVVDTGWELDNRNPYAFKGATLKLFMGNGVSLDFVPDEEWFGREMPRFYNHMGSHGDLDNDGDIDIVVAAMSGPIIQGGVRVLINDGNARFSEHVFTDAQTGLVGGPSGVVVVESVDGPRIIASGYRSWTEESPSSVPGVFRFSNGRLIREASIEKPFPNSTVWMNYGGADAYAVDINNDGLEDYVQLWETEPTNTGIFDEWSHIGDLRVESRYETLGMNDDMVAVYLQNSAGEFLLSSVFPLAQDGSPLLEFADVNNDGWVDFYTHGYHVKRNSIHETIWLNDGTGQFGKPTEIPVQGFGPRLSVTGFLLDFDKDNDFDFLGLWGHGGGERLVVFENHGVDFELDDATVVNHLISMRDFFGFQVEQALQNDRSKVLQLQTALNQLGYNAGSPDGIFGPATRSAIEAFNADYSGRFVAGLTQSNAAAILSAVE